jgi:acyl-coenzyme A synthetase/AMP-(fatty) acid ligase
VEIRGISVICQYASPGHEGRFSPDGWLRTGDLGYLDEDGYVFLVGREDDVINRGGFKVMPHDVEEVILEERSVAEAVVVARADRALGEVPVAFVVLCDAAQEPAVMAEVLAAVASRCGAGLARPSRPVELHLVKALPAGPTGKVRRRSLDYEPLVPLASMMLP